MGVLVTGAPLFVYMRAPDFWKLQYAKTLGRTEGAHKVEILYVDIVIYPYIYI